MTVLSNLPLNPYL